jgi:hypothetical protein
MPLVNRREIIMRLSAIDHATQATFNGLADYVALAPAVLLFAGRFYCHSAADGTVVPGQGRARQSTA